MSGSLTSGCMITKTRSETKGKTRDSLRPLRNSIQDALQRMTGADRTSGEIERLSLLKLATQNTVVVTHIFDKETFHSDTEISIFVPALDNIFS